MSTHEWTVGGYTIQHNSDDPTVPILPSDSRNAATDSALLAHWATGPDHAVWYDDGHGLITTWLGVVVGTVTSRSRPYWCGFGRQIHITFTGTNGRRYYGRLSADWSQLLRCHAYKH